LPEEEGSLAGAVAGAEPSVSEESVVWFEDGLLAGVVSLESLPSPVLAWGLLVLPAESEESSVSPLPGACVGVGCWSDWSGSDVCVVWVPEWSSSDCEESSVALGVVSLLSSLTDCVVWVPEWSSWDWDESSVPVAVVSLLSALTGVEAFEVTEGVPDAVAFCSEESVVRFGVEALPWAMFSDAVAEGEVAWGAFVLPAGCEEPSVVDFSVVCGEPCERTDWSCGVVWELCSTSLPAADRSWPSWEEGPCLLSPADWGEAEIN